MGYAETLGDGVQNSLIGLVTLSTICDTANLKTTLPFCFR
jgi:hypothetical protein